ncbi:hypothetical protein PC9H_000904 [Pleurotus ostreatus]|uniref:CCHC-type domain-containing protein n=1 Tax=Pleurotus ostreatus TaxID=5322 RepID=A0A8H7DY76_PLEOS|nr:uncharacterized protein PC9H_000904 [Pleurotus ostreatus]KAF7440558.1 hypothetical protein PC9H_000904 [Pleurotus ostreatus]
MAPTSTTKPAKILTVGSAVGALRDLFSKVKGINAKHGPFDFVLCAGDFFGPPSTDNTSGDDQITQLLDGKLEVPLECYIMQGEYPLPDNVIQKFAQTGGELCKNVFLLSKSGILTTPHGLRIACLGGVYETSVFASAEAAPGFASPFFSKQTTEKLLANTMTNSASSKPQNYTSLAAIRSQSAPTQLVDILMTNAWPSSIAHFSSVPLPSPDLPAHSAPPLDEVIRNIKPRYHFAAKGGQPPVFWEREPYTWDRDSDRVSRFVSLGAFGGEVTTGKKPRWFYAFSISPASADTANAVKPPNSTKNPFTEYIFQSSTKRPIEGNGENFIFGSVQHPNKRNRMGDPSGKPPPGYKCKRCESTEHFINDCPERVKPPEGYICRICNEPGHLVRDCPTKHAVGDTGGRKPREGYVCRACGSEGHYIDDCPVANQRHPQGDRRGKRGPPKEIGPDECWFCLSNPSVAKHLIVSIGMECYVTLPKGQIIPTQSSADHVDVPGGGHVLIIPIAHYPTFTTIPPDLAPPVLEETERYKTALRAFYAKHRSAAVFFEVGRLSMKGGHAHVQAVPIPEKMKEDVKTTFLEQGRMQGIDFEEDPVAAMESCQNGRGSYFKVELPDGGTMVHLLKDHVPFSIQFGRQVLTTLLNMPERLDWKECVLSQEEDTADATAFKAAFAVFDPSS